MARVSTKENKNIYQLTRESLKLTRESASELLETISPERIEKIENERSLPYPDEVLTMAEKYRQPNLCNYYCANQCPIGQQYVPEIQIKDLSQIVLEMLASLNSMHRQKERLIEITADGRISGDELADFIYIQEALERISITVETLQLWSEKMLATGVIDIEQYIGDPIYYESEEIEAMTFLEHAVPYIESKPEAGWYDPDLEMKYSKVDEGIVVLYMDKWYLCVPADTAISD